jgi:hypothetical protein
MLSLLLTRGSGIAPKPNAERPVIGRRQETLGVKLNVVHASFVRFFSVLGMYVTTHYM